MRRGTRTCTVASWSSRVAFSHAKKLQYLCCSRIDDDDAGYRDMKGGGAHGDGDGTLSAIGGLAVVGRLYYHW